MLHDNLPMNSS